MKLGKNRKLRIIINNIGLHLTVGQIDTVFCTTQHRIAVTECLAKIEDLLAKREPCRGMATTVNDVHIQIDLI